MAANPDYDEKLALYLVEPSAVVSESLATLLEDRVRSIKCFANAEALLAGSLAMAPRRVLITELRLPGISGIDLMLALEARNLSTPTIIMTVDTNFYTAVEAIRKGAFNVLEKPCIAGELLDGLSRVETALG